MVGGKNRHEIVVVLLQKVFRCKNAFALAGAHLYIVLMLLGPLVDDASARFDPEPHFVSGGRAQYKRTIVVEWYHNPTFSLGL